MIAYSISAGPGTLVERGTVANRALASEAFDEHVFIIGAKGRVLSHPRARPDATYEKDGTIHHTTKGRYSMTTMVVQADYPE